MKLIYSFWDKDDPGFLFKYNVFSLGNYKFGHTYTAEMHDCRLNTMLEF